MATGEHKGTERSVTRRSIPGSSDAEERLLAMVTAVTAQLAVTRERVDTLERLLARAGLLDSADIEEFAATEDETIKRDAVRRGIISKVFRPLQESTDRDLRRARSATAEAAPDKD